MDIMYIYKCQYEIQEQKEVSGISAYTDLFRELIYLSVLLASEEAHCSLELVK
jgi:hypothetical protein